MPFDPSDPKSNDVHNLDDVNNRLYRRDLAGRKVPHIDSLTERRFPVKKEWPNIGEQKEKIARTAAHPTLFRKFFYFSIGFAVLAVIIAAVTLFTGGNTVSSNNIDINILGNSFTAGGEELPLQVEIANKNASSLELADLFVEYDKGGDASSGASHVRTLNSLGTIDAGKTVNKSFFVSLYGEEGSVKNIDFTLQYRLKGSNAIFTKKNTFAVTISSAPVALSVDAPATVTPNQDLSFTIKTKSNAKSTLSGMLLRVDYPNGFKVTKASPAATSFDNIWNLGDLAPGAERDVVVTGTVYGTDGEDRAFHIYAGAVSATDSTKIGVTYNSLLQTVSLVKPFVAAHILINGSDAASVPVPSSSVVQGTISYANNLPTQVTNAEIRLDLSGNALNAGSITSSKGFYDSSKQQIVWNSTTDSDLATLQPSDQGQLDFSFRVLPLIASGTPISQPSIKLSVSIAGKQPAEGGSVSQVTNTETKTAVVSSDLGFSSDAFYYSGPFTNTGPIPPKANQPTTYTITWTVTNSANILHNGLATSTLPTYVEWVGTMSPAGSALTYDPTTRTLRWNIGDIPAGTGLAGPAKTVSFQVRLNPSTSQVGSTPKLVLDTAVSANDAFTGEPLSTSRAAVSTLLQNDIGFPAGGEAVTN